MSSTKFSVLEKTGVLGRSRKAVADTLRVVIDFSRWLDTGETIGSLSRFSLKVDTDNEVATAWQVDYPFETTTDSAAIADTVPLILTGATITGAKANILLGAGTPKLTYIVSFVATGATSGRVREVDFFVTVDEMVNDEMITSLDPAQSSTVTVVSGTTALAANTTGAVFVQNGSAAPITITLPASPVMDQTITIVDVTGNAATYTITLVGAAGATINDHATYPLTMNYAAITVRWNGTKWVVA